MANTKEKIDALVKRLTPIQKRLELLVDKVATTTETSNAFWNGVKRETSELYDGFRVVYAEWTELHMPIEYNKNIVRQLGTINGRKLSPPPNDVKTREFVGSKKNKKTIDKLVDENIKDYWTGLGKGEKILNKLYNLAQQVKIKEKEFKQTAKEGFEEKGSIGGAKKKLLKKLLDAYDDGKFVAIIDKNGDLRQYKATTYAELLARTYMNEAFTAGTINTAQAVGSDLVQVSSHNTKTAYDAQFEGKIFSLSGKDPDFPKATDLPPFHPNCLHVITVVIKEALEVNGTLKEYSDFSKGKRKSLSFKKSFIPVDKRTLVA
jgi:hypothetical protein